ncbi:MAG: DNA polymerase I [Chloroflexota bacterium]
MPDTLYLIDAYAQIFRAYYAIRNGMRSPAGEPTHAIFGFTAMLLKLFAQFHPQYVVVATDTGRTFRDDLFPEYKGTRRATPDDLTSQVPRILELIDLFGIPVIGHPGLEADDVIATITQRVLDNPACAGVDVRIVSKDKDLEQLLGARVTLFDIHTDTTIDVAALLANKGIAPAQVIDVLALTGDTVDNVPGVAGIGPKTAAQLVQQFGSLDGILANLDQIKGKRREALEGARDHLPLSLTLVTLKRDADFPFSLDSARVRPIDIARIIPFFQSLGFHRFQDEVRRLGEADLSPGPFPTREGERQGESAPTGAPTSPQGKGARGLGSYHAITTMAGLQDLAATLRAQEIIAVDTETTGLERDARLCGLSFAWQEGHGVYVPTRSPDPSAHLDAATVLSVLRPVLEDPDVGKCGHNLKFDAGVLLREGIRLRGIVFDSLLAAMLIDPSQSSHKLDHLALSLLGYQMIPITDLIGEGAEQASMDTVPLDQITTYAAEDADVALRLYYHLAPKLEEMRLSALLRDVEGPLTGVLAEMEANGILCDADELQRQGEDLAGRVDDLRRRVKEVAGCEFQLDSPKQLAEVLFDRLGLTPGRKTKTGRSTDVQVLERLAAQEDRNDPRTTVPGLVIEYRQLNKLISTYLGNLRESVSPSTGRIHSTFHQLVAATGRLASQNPNLQNIPVRRDIGRQIRKAFLAPPAHVLLCADYSQVELRILAHYSEDPALLDAFAQDLDIHAAVASQVFGVPLDAVTREQRNHAKTINFGIIYGITPFGLARRIEGLDVAAATELIAGYKQRFPGIETFLRCCVQQALEQGYVTTILGRCRAIPELQSSNYNTRNLGERLAINSVVQGSAADLIKVAMVNVQRRIDRDRLPMKLLLQIHDELVLEAPAEVASEQAIIVREEMEQALTLRVPLRAEVGTGLDWMSAK